MLSLFSLALLLKQDTMAYRLYSDHGMYGLLSSCVLLPNNVCAMNSGTPCLTIILLLYNQKERDFKIWISLENIEKYFRLFFFYFILLLISVANGFSCTFMFSTCILSCINPMSLCICKRWYLCRYVVLYKRRRKKQCILCY